MDGVTRRYELSHNGMQGGASNGSYIQPRMLHLAKAPCSQVDSSLPDFSIQGQENGLEKQKRKMCKRCEKVIPLCICKLFSKQVDNKIRITILQHPGERDHHLGSVRIAKLGLKNVEVLRLSELDSQISYRVRPKVPGSKRCIARRGGKKLSLEQLALSTKQVLYNINNDVVHGHFCDLPILNKEPPDFIKLIPSTGLLFPTDEAIELPSGALSSFDCMIEQFQEMDICNGHGIERPGHLIVLDGTWSKAKRLYCENPWLHNLPHYKLPDYLPSIYGSIRPEPKAGCLSTIESIVYALRTLEPETRDLEMLLEVFDLMIENQQQYMRDMQQKCKPWHAVQVKSN